MTRPCLHLLPLPLRPPKKEPEHRHEAHGPKMLDYFAPIHPLHLTTNTLCTAEVYFMIFVSGLVVLLMNVSFVW